MENDRTRLSLKARPDGPLATDTLPFSIADARGLTQGDAAGRAGPLAQCAPEPAHHQAGVEHQQQHGQHLHRHLGSLLP